MDTLFHQDIVVAPLGSGSRGNATYVGDGKHGVLIDCGLSTRQIQLRMEHIGLRDAPIDAVLITHEHSDHVAAAGVLERYHARHVGTELPFYMTAGTAAGVPLRCRPQDIRTVTPGSAFTVGGLRVETVTVPHDTRDPIAFTVASGSTRVGVLTDLGTPTRLLVRQLASLDVVVLEFNHDVEMLMDGDYPWHLKQRIRSHHGHLSNQQAGKLLSEACKLSGRLKHVMLGHLSEENNSPAKAMDACEAALASVGRHDVEVRIAEQDKALEPAVISRPMVFDAPRPNRTPPPAIERRARTHDGEDEVSALLQGRLFPAG